MGCVAAYDYWSMCGPAGTLLRAGSAWAYYETTRDEPRAGPGRSLATNRYAIGDTSLTRTAGPRPVGGVLQWCADVTSDGVYAVISQETTVAVGGLER